MAPYRERVGSNRLPEKPRLRFLSFDFIKRFGWWLLFAKLLRLLLLFFAALALICLVLLHNTNKIHILKERFVVWTVANIIIINVKLVYGNES